MKNKIFYAIMIAIPVVFLAGTVFLLKPYLMERLGPDIVQYAVMNMDEKERKIHSV